jgi:hypothetical protein
MLKQFNSNNKKLNRIIPKINPNNLISADLTGSLLAITIPSTTRFNSNTKKLLKAPIVLNYNKANDDLYLTASLENIELPSSASYESYTRTNSNTNIIVNNRQSIIDFHNEILENSGRTIIRTIDTFDDNQNTLTIYNVALDYGTAGVNSDNFEIIVSGLNIPGDYTIKEVGNNVVITLNDRYIDFDNVILDDIYVIGKLVDVPIATEDNFNITTEDGLDIII